jgi:hypothetical protein
LKSIDSFTDRFLKIISSTFNRYYGLDFYVVYKPTENE